MSHIFIGTRRFDFMLAFLLLFASSSVSGQSSGQTLIQLIKSGDEKIAQGDFYAASLYYKDALSKDGDNVELNYKFAEASRMFNDYEGATTAYKRVVDLDKIIKYPLSLFWLGEMLRSSCTCNSAEAIKDFRRFKNRYHPKDYYSAKAQQEIEACSWVLDHQKQIDTINIEHLGKDVNTTNSEFNAIPVYPDKIQFSSLRNIAEDKKGGQYLVRIYNQQPNPEKIYMPNGSNPDLNIGNGAYTSDTKTFYFTQCEQKTKVTTRCDIYVTRFENYKWSDAQKLSINDAEATNTQPAVGYDNSGQPVLFFASNRGGGQGGLDIWVSKINSDQTYSEPVNAGKVINTSGNEITPFYDANSKSLYFSSDWHYGFGGYDIFKTKGEYSQWTAPVNLMQPINTAQNDLYYVRTNDDSRSYITSNRKGSYFIEAATCCNDIYAYGAAKMPPPKIDTPVVAEATPETIKDTVPTVVETTPVVPKETIPVPKDETAMVVKQDTPVAHREEPPRQFIDVQVKKIKQLLPVELYFHNDEPDCCNLKDTTALDYKQTYEAYSAMENVYKREFSKGLKGDEKTAAQNQINDLFAKNVDKGFYDLVAFTSQLLDILKGGNKIEITVEGYCSPLHLSDYNIKLGYRRVASLRNYFYHYRDGALLPYIANGTLVLKSASFGKDKAPKTVSDKLEDTRNSVYNPAAALERRVEILSVEVK